MVRITNIDIVDVVPSVVSNGVGLHDFPAVGIFDDFGKSRSTACATFHLFFDVFGIENCGATFDSNGFANFLHSVVISIAIVAQIGFGLFASNGTYCQIHASHKLVDVIETESAPSVALPRLNDGVGADKRRLECLTYVGLPHVFGTIEGTHVVEVDFCDLAFGLPTVARLHHVGNACAIVAVLPTKDAVSGHLLGFLRRQATTGKQLFAIGYALCDIVGCLTIVGVGSHLHGAIDEKQTRSGKVAKLTRSLHNDIYAWTCERGCRD